MSARKTQEQRRRETREAVLNAAAQVLTEEGYPRFSAARVAARAGVSRGALERYFPTKNELLVAVTEHVLDRAVNEARLLAARGPRHSDPINRFLLDSEHFFFSPVYRSMIELAIAANGDNELAEPHNAIVLRGRKELNSIWLDALVEAGFARRNAELFVELTHYFLRGLFLASTWLPYKPNRRALLQAWSELAPGLLRVDETPDLALGRRRCIAAARPRMGLKKKA
jgi:AcrR family transcriptional regulator